MGDSEITVGDRVRVGEWLGAVDETAPEGGLCHVVFDGDSAPANWYDATVVVLLPREVKDPVEIIAAALTAAERSFSVSVGQGAVPPGQYLTDRDKAREIVASLEAAGFEVRPVG